MMRYLLPFVLLVLIGFAPACAQQRVALVIGNGAYSGEAALPNAVRDAELIAEGFNSLGFRVMLHRNLDHAGLKRALQAFEMEAAGAEVAAIYFAGHGIAVDGLNWMLPVDAKLASANHVDDEAVRHTRFIAAVGGAKGLQLVILDACRDNPYTPRLAQQVKEQAGTTRNVATRGLEPIPDRELSPNRLVAFSARDGQRAQDGPPGTNGPYAKALRSRMEKSGTEIYLLFRQVRDDVIAATNNKQEPWTYANLGKKELYLLPTAVMTATTVPAVPAAPTPVPSPEAVELAFWQTIQSSRNRADFEAYLIQYPQGRFAALAKNRLIDPEGTTAAAPGKPESESPMSRDDRQRIQRVLSSQGHDIGNPDGLFGERTRSAIINWQTKHGYPATGYLSDQQRDSLLRQAMPRLNTPPGYMIFFYIDRSDLSPEALARVRQAAGRYRAADRARIVLTGHSDGSELAKEGVALSLRRANAVKDALVREGVPEIAITVIGRGDRDPFLQTGDGVREPQDRRVEVVIQ